MKLHWSQQPTRACGSPFAPAQFSHFLVCADGSQPVRVPRKWSEDHDYEIDLDALPRGKTYHLCTVLRTGEVSIWSLPATTGDVRTAAELESVEVGFNAPCPPEMLYIQ
jgi:hypothetical protein